MGDVSPSLLLRRSATAANICPALDLVFCAVERSREKPDAAQTSTASSPHLPSNCRRGSIGDLAKKVNAAGAIFQQGQS
jgi:hypothetical protein